MKLTEEQLQIIHSTGNIKVNAVAGSGKTSTLVQFAKSRPLKKFLYIVFNKSAKVDAERKFLNEGCYNVTVTTAHGLAYREIVSKRRYTVENNTSINNIRDALGFKNGLDGLKNAKSAMNSMEKFMNSGYKTFADFYDSESGVTKESVENAEEVYSMMKNKKIDSSHSFYLKEFHLSNPVIKGYDYIMYDEFQDSNAPMAEVFLNQSSTKICVGDTNQALYSWRGSINSLENVDFEELRLTSSFRFGEEIAALANEALELKHLIGKSEDVMNVVGLGSHSRYPENVGFVARTNMSLITIALDVFKSTKNIYFEGGIGSYTFMDETSVYDVYNYLLGDESKVRSPILKPLKGRGELEAYIDAVGDNDLMSMIKIVDEYGHNTIQVLNKLKYETLDIKSKNKADVVMATAHRSKGMEYDLVNVCSDFITEDSIKDIVKFREFKSILKNGGAIDFRGECNDHVLAEKIIGQDGYEFYKRNNNNRYNELNINEEINSLYVAVTRGLMSTNFDYDQTKRLLDMMVKTKVRKNEEVVVNEWNRYGH